MLMRLQHNQPSEARWEIIGELYFLAGEFERAMEPLERAATWRGKTTALVQKRRLLGLRWEAAQQLGDPHLAASAELSYLSVRHQLDRHTIGEIEAALNRARENQWPDLVSKGLMVLAQHLRWKQRFDQSLPHIQEALEVLQAAGLPTLEVEREYADLLAYADRHEEAMEAYLICMKTYRALKDDAGIAWCHYGIGYIEQQWGNQTEALKHLQKAADWYRSVGDLSQAAAVDNSISDCLFMLGRYEEARAIAESASRQYNREGRHIPEAYANLALIAMALDEVGEFKRYATLVARYGHDASHYWGVLAGLAALEHDWEKWDDFVSRIATGSWDRKLDIANSLSALLKCTQIAGDERRAAIIEETEREYRAMIAARATPR